MILVRAAFLVFVLTALLGSVFFIGGGEVYLNTFLLFFFIFNFVALLYGSRFSLGLFKARKLNKKVHKDFYNAVNSYCVKRNASKPKLYFYDSNEIDLIFLKDFFDKSGSWLISRGAFESLNEHERNQLIYEAIEYSLPNLFTEARTYISFVVYCIFSILSFPFKFLDKIIEFLGIKKVPKLEGISLFILIPITEFSWKAIGENSYQRRIRSLLKDQEKGLNTSDSLIIKSVNSKKNSTPKYDFYNLCRMYGYRRDLLASLLS